MSDARREARGARFDEAIDRAVREMLDVEPPADLRARVMTQLTASDSRLPVSGFRLPALGWALAAAAVILLAVVLTRRSEPLPQAPVVAADRHLPAETVTSVRTPEAAPRSVSAPIAVSVGRPPRTAVDRGLVVAAAVADDNATTVIAPLKTIAPISVAPITQNAIAPAEVAVRPLNTITEIQIAPLTPPDRR